MGADHTPDHLGVVRFTDLTEVPWRNGGGITVDHQSHPLALDHGDEAIDTGIARKGPGFVHVRDAEPPVETSGPESPLS